MGKAVFIFSAIIFFYGILSSSGSKKLIWFFAGIIFFSDRIMLIDVPTKMSFDRFLVYALIVSEFLRLNKAATSFKSFPIKYPLLIFFFGLLCIGLFDERIGLFLKLYRPVDYFFQTTLVSFLCYSSLNNIKGWTKFLKFLLISSIPLSIYGFYNFFAKSNPLDHLFTALYHSVSPFDDYALSGERFRINSFVSHPIYYGYLCGVLLLITIYCFYFSKELKRLSIICIPLLLSNLILANSRTPIVAFVIGLLLFITIAFRNMRKFQIAALLAITGIVLVSIPAVSGKLKASADLLKMDGGKTSGSSLNMRVVQLQASYNEFLKKPAFGNGLYFIEENLGWADAEQERISDPDFEGFESYLYQLLIEQGAMGIVTTFIFVISIGFYFLKNRKISSEVTSLGLSVLTMFILFSFGTGTLHSWVISMGIIGIAIKYIELKRRERQSSDTRLSRNRQ